MPERKRFTGDEKPLFGAEKAIETNPICDRVRVIGDEGLGGIR